MTNSLENLAIGLVGLSCVRDGHVFLLGVLVDPDDPDKVVGNTLIEYREGKFSRQDLVGERLLDICAAGPVDEGVFLLAADHSVSLVAGDTRLREPLPRQGSHLGKLSCIKSFGDSVFAVGLDGQVYRRTERGWECLDDGLFDAGENLATVEEVRGFQSKFFTSIAAKNAANLYVVGLAGLVYHFDGGRWTRSELPTNVNLNAVSFGEGEEMFTAGDGGWFFRCDGGEFQTYRLPNEQPVWDLAVFEDRLYLSTFECLYTFDGQEIEEVDAALEAPLEPYRLGTTSGELWSMSVDDLAFFKAGVWERVLLAF